MLLGILILVLVGALLVALGYLVWKKKKITLFHDYHYHHVSPENIPPFCTVSGLGLVCIGAGLLATAITLGITNAAWSFALLAIGFAVGLSLLLYAGRTYNR